MTARIMGHERAVPLPRPWAASVRHGRDTIVGFASTNQHAGSALARTTTLHGRLALTTLSNAISPESCTRCCQACRFAGVGGCCGTAYHSRPSATPPWETRSTGQPGPPTSRSARFTAPG